MVAPTCGPSYSRSRGGRKIMEETEAKVRNPIWKTNKKQNDLGWGSSGRALGLASASPQFSP
jgi:hypothetical protein